MSDVYNMRNKTTPSVPSLRSSAKIIYFTPLVGPPPSPSTPPKHCKPRAKVKTSARSKKSDTSAATSAGAAIALAAAATITAPASKNGVKLIKTVVITGLVVAQCLGFYGLWKLIKALQTELDGIKAEQDVTSHMTEEEVATIAREKLEEILEQPYRSHPSPAPQSQVTLPPVSNAPPSTSPELAKKMTSPPAPDVPAPVPDLVSSIAPTMRVTFVTATPPLSNPQSLTDPTPNAPPAPSPKCPPLLRTPSQRNNVMTLDKIDETMYDIDSPTNKPVDINTWHYASIIGIIVHIIAISDMADSIKVRTSPQWNTRPLSSTHAAGATTTSTAAPPGYSTSRHQVPWSINAFFSGNETTA
ncbi:hypothetical protein JKP88DRAFT_243118 [Tribonema minus]|uniref:Uncharacterized protein n=1 Tax=Tribonema minus TaxID=303371 RepID=A0A835ZDP9_9STRA|nr:hypothetical protein JKP88DRAFT_243118 [Tribonema minus]